MSVRLSWEEARGAWDITVMLVINTVRYLAGVCAHLSIMTKIRDLEIIKNDTNEMYK